MTVHDPKDRDRYVVAEPFETVVLFQFSAPFTDGAHRVLPSGLVFEICDDPVPTATAVSARPSESERWEAELVGQEILRDGKYAGYSLAISKADLASRCTKIR